MHATRRDKVIVVLASLALFLPSLYASGLDFSVQTNTHHKLIQANSVSYEPFNFSNSSHYLYSDYAPTLFNDPPYVINVIDLATGKSVQNLTVGTGPDLIKITPNGTLLVALQSAGGVTIYNLKTQAVVKHIGTSSDNPFPSSIAISPDGQYVYAAGGGNNISIISLKTLSLDKVLYTDCFQSNVAFTPDGSLCYAFSPNRNITLIDVGTSTIIGTFSTTVVNQLAAGRVSPDGSLLALLGGGTRVAILYTSNFTEKFKVELPGYPSDATFSADGSTLYAVNNNFYSPTGVNLSVINLQTQSLKNIAISGFGPDVESYSIAVSSDGSQAYIPDAGLNRLAIVNLTSETYTGWRGGVQESDSVALPSTSYFGELKIQESGLPQNTQWTATIGNNVWKSSSSRMNATAYDGSYSVMFHSSDSSYSSSPVSVDLANGTPVNINVVFNPVAYGVKFTESGLPADTKWQVVVDSHSYSATGNNITVALQNGSHAYSISLNGYTVSKATGTLNISGSGANVSVTFSKPAVLGLSQSYMTYAEWGVIALIGIGIGFGLGRRKKH